jgi:hypothetical protein
MIRRNIAQINAGDYRRALAMYGDDLGFSFPGDNSWAGEFQPFESGRPAHVTHHGKAEMERFLQRYVVAAMQMEVEDMLVNGRRGTCGPLSVSTSGPQANRATGTRTGRSCSSRRRGASSALKRTTRTPNARRRSNIPFAISVFPDELYQAPRS